MVATGDDKSRSRGKWEMSPRDNVVFELGLFMGRLGRDRTFYVFEKGIKLPSDLLGVTLPQFPKRNGAEKQRVLKECAETIRDHVRGRGGIFDGGIFPSVPLAFGYFNNFVEIVCRRLRISQEAKINGKLRKVPDFELHILIPDDLKDDMKAKVANAKDIRKWQQISVQAPETRAYDFFADVSFTSGKAILKDVPTTLLSLHQTIAEFLKVHQVGVSQKEKLVEAREIRRFQAVLDHLIEQSATTRGRVRTEIVDI
jgi:hypothetical protein